MSERLNKLDLVKVLQMLTGNAVSNELTVAMLTQRIRNAIGESSSSTPGAPMTVVPQPTPTTDLGSILDMLRSLRYSDSKRPLIDGKTLICGQVRGGLAVGTSDPKIRLCILSLNAYIADYFDDRFNSFTTVVINQSTMAAEHVDSQNRGFSCILALGDFEGGNLRFGDTKEEVSVRRPYIFDGKRPHSNTDYTGERYSVIWFTHTYPMKQANRQVLLDLNFKLPALQLDQDQPNLQQGDLVETNTDDDGKDEKKQDEKKGATRTRTTPTRTRTTPTGTRAMTGTRTPTATRILRSSGCARSPAPLSPP
jgi:hypothetical protein